MTEDTREAQRMSKYKAPVLSGLTELQLTELSERYGGYPMDIWEEKEHPDYPGMDIPPYWDVTLYNSEIPTELYQRWQLLFWRLRQLPRHPSSKRIASDLGIPVSFVNTMRGVVAREAVSRLPDEFLGRARERQAFALENIISHSMRMFMNKPNLEDLISRNNRASDDDSDDSDGGNYGELSHKIRIDYGKLAVTSIKEQAALLGTSAPKSPTSFSAVQVNMGSSDKSKVAEAFGLSEADMAAIGNQIASKMAKVKMDAIGAPQEAAVDAEFIETEPE